MTTETLECAPRGAMRQGDDRLLRLALQFDEVATGAVGCAGREAHPLEGIPGERPLSFLCRGREPTQAWMAGGSPSRPAHAPRSPRSRTDGDDPLSLRPQYARPLTVPPPRATLYVHFGRVAGLIRGRARGHGPRPGAVREGRPMAGYCMKCREKREMRDAQQVTLKNGREATQGSCSVCGTKITVMGGAKAAEK